MKTTVTSICAMILLAGTIGLNAAEPVPQVKKSSPEFERMKSLVGTWTGKSEMPGQGVVDLKVQYRLLAGGSVLEERCFQGTPGEMITMYYDQGDKLAMTHYCSLGNRPAMTLASSDAKSLKFDFDSTCGINPTKESHMHALTIRFDDADTITTTCKAIIDGKETDPHSTTLTRAKSS
jgi:hypothetical protein